MPTCMNGLTRYLLSPTRVPRTRLSGVKARDLQREVKTPWIFTAACCCDVGFVVQCRWELLESLDESLDLDTDETPPFKTYVTNSGPPEDTSRWAVWLGRHPAEKVSVGPKGQLSGFRNSA
jgi:hypothetical protein